jgi:hypothetical protein
MSLIFAQKNSSEFVYIYCASHAADGLTQIQPTGMGQTLGAVILRGGCPSQIRFDATNTLAYAIQRFIGESKGETIKRLHRENCAESFVI